MPYQGAELQAFLCNKWAKENGYLYDPNGDVFISVANGYEVTVPLADDNRDVQVTYYQGCGLLKLDVRKSSMPNPYGKRKRCKTAREAVPEFTSTPDKKTHRNQRDVTEKATPCNCTPHDEANTSIGNVTVQDTPVNCPSTPVNCTVVPDYEYAGDYDLVIGKDGKKYRVRTNGADAGFVDGLCRDYENERAGFKSIEDKCLQSCNPYKTCAFTLGTYVKQSFADIQDAVKSLSKKEEFLFNEYANLKCVFPFLEPYADGGWHVHMILCFYDEIPDNLYEKVLKEWKKHIIIPTETYKLDEYLVKMRKFPNAEEFVKYLEYLNPVSKKKRDRLKFYPRGRKARQGYGDFEEPNKVILPADEAKKLTEREHIALRHEIKIVNASSTISSGKEDVKYHGFTYYFTRNEALWNAIISDRNDFCESETAPQITDLQPHFSITVFTKCGEQFGKTMTEVDFDYDIEKAIKLADFYERNSKLFGGVEVVREGIPIQQGVSMA